MDRLLTVREAAEKLNCHPHSVYRLVESNEIPHIKRPGIGLRFKNSRLEEWLEKSTKTALEKRLNYIDNQLFGLTLPPNNRIVISDGKHKGGKGEMAKYAKSATRLNLGYGAVYQRKTKQGRIRWYLDYRDAKGKRVQKVAMHALTIEDAQVALQKEVAGALNGEYGIKDPKTRVTLREFTGTYLENYAAIRKRSWRSDERYLNSQLVPHFGDLELHEISPLHVSRFIAQRLKDGVRKSTINRELTVLKKMLNLAIEWDFKIAKNPVIKGNYFPEDEYRRNRVLTPEEEARLFMAASAHLVPILTCALATGMRFSEVLGLCWRDIDLEKSQITVRAESSKSGKARVIPMNQSLCRVLAGLMSSNGHEGHVFLYKDPLTGKERPLKTIRKAFNQACQRADIKNLRFHDLRHTFGSRLIERGADPVSVKNLLGHANLKTTEIYLHSSLGQMKRAVGLLDQDAALGVPKSWDLLRICDTARRLKTKNRPNDSTSIN